MKQRVISDFDKASEGSYRREANGIIEEIEVLPDGKYIVDVCIDNKTFQRLGRGKEAQALHALHGLRMRMRMYYGYAALKLREAKGQELDEYKFLASYALSLDSELIAKIKNDFHKP